ncbi:hypothetical protein [Streptomyces shenzhenensis]|uniref:hypothetical protein n=1 Tax=Streptomyces shenzhenensis TaxID=943815 RepID=UPI0033D5C1AC
MSEVLAPAGEVRWAAGLIGTAPALLAGHDRPVVHAPGRTVNRMSTAHRGKAKTEAPGFPS